MADHTNAVKAMVLYFDFHKKYLVDRINRPEVLSSGISEPMLAATYNGGPGRLLQAINKDGFNWQKSSSLAPETASYVEKFQTLSTLNIFK